MEKLNQVKEFVTAYKIPLILGLVGSTFLLIAIVVAVMSMRSSSSSLTFTSRESSEATVAGVLTKEFIVDIQGAVNAPGVYKLSEGSRVADLLEKAGGLSADANSDWVAKNLNQAQKLVDGAKLYIPSRDESSNDKIQMSNQIQSSNIKININSASASELESLAGIGEKTAEKIIAGRPYTTLEELVSRKIVFQSTFEKIKDEITVLGN